MITGARRPAPGAPAIPDQSIMTPNEVKRSIDLEHQRQLCRAARGEATLATVDMLARQEARAGARHNGQPHLWREYLPEGVEPD